MAPAGPTGAWARAAAGAQRLRVLAVSRIKGDLVALARVTELLTAQRVDIDAIVAMGPLNRRTDERPPPVSPDEDRGAYYAGARGGYAAEREGEASAVLAVLENLASHVYYVPDAADGPHLRKRLALGMYPSLTSHSLNVYQDPVPLRGIGPTVVSMDAAEDVSAYAPKGGAYVIAGCIEQLIAADSTVAACRAWASHTAVPVAAPDAAPLGPLPEHTLAVLTGGPVPGIARLPSGALLVCCGEIAGATSAWAILDMERPAAHAPWALTAALVSQLEAIDLGLHNRSIATATGTMSA